MARLRVAPMLTLALVLRALAAATMFRGDPRLWFYDQASELTCLAHAILSGQGLSSPFGGSTGPSAFLAPGYPLLVAAVYLAFGAYSVGAAVMIVSLQVLFGMLTVLTTMLLARRLFGDKVAFMAGVFCAVSPTMIWLPTLFWETSLSTLLISGLLLFALKCVDEPRPAWWIAIGAYCGLAMFVNPSLLILFAAIVGWAAYKTECVSRRLPVLAAVTCALVFSVWPIRNAIELHAFVPLRSNLGYEVWQGNRVGSKGFFVQDLYLNANHQEYAHYAAVGELAFMHEKSAIAAAAIKGDPARFLRLTLKRMAIFWTALGGHGISRVVLGEIALTSICSIAGLALLRRRQVPGATLLLLPFLLFPLPYYITHPDFRFRLLLQPTALLLTAWLVQQCAEYVKARRTQA